MGTITFHEDAAHLHDASRRITLYATVASTSFYHPIGLFFFFFCTGIVTSHAHSTTLLPVLGSQQAGTAVLVIGVL
jgi:hypothetical protein